MVPARDPHQALGVSSCTRCLLVTLTLGLDE